MVYRKPCYFFFEPDFINLGVDIICLNVVLAVVVAVIIGDAVVLDVIVVIIDVGSQM